MNAIKLYLSQRLLSMSHAFNGLVVLFQEEKNARIHLVIAAIVVCSGIFFKITAIEWMLLLLAITAVIAMELVNTALENMIDFVSIEEHPKIKKTKDLAAASVLVFALLASIIGLIVFVPHVRSLLD